MPKQMLRPHRGLLGTAWGGRVMAGDCLQDVDLKFLGTAHSLGVPLCFRSSQPCHKPLFNCFAEFSQVNLKTGLWNRQFLRPSDPNEMKIDALTLTAKSVSFLALFCCDVTFSDVSAMFCGLQAGCTFTDYFLTLRYSPSFNYPVTLLI